MEAGQHGRWLRAGQCQYRRRPGRPAWPDFAAQSVIVTKTVTILKGEFIFGPIHFQNPVSHSDRSELWNFEIAESTRLRFSGCNWSMTTFRVNFPRDGKPNRWPSAEGTATRPYPANQLLVVKI